MTVSLWARPPDARGGRDGPLSRATSGSGVRRSASARDRRASGARAQGAVDEWDDEVNGLGASAPPAGYCDARDVVAADGLSNIAVCGDATAYEDVAYKLTIDFDVCSAEVGDWALELTMRAGRGGAWTLDGGSPVSLDLSGSGAVALGSHSLSAGRHRIAVYAYHDCCEGAGSEARVRVRAWDDDDDHLATRARPERHRALGGPANGAAISPTSRRAPAARRGALGAGGGGAPRPRLRVDGAIAGDAAGELRPAVGARRRDAGGNGGGALYVNGVRDAAAFGHAVPDRSCEALALGAAFDDGDSAAAVPDFFGGAIADVRLFDYAMAEASVVDLYNRGAFACGSRLAARGGACEGSLQCGATANGTTVGLPSVEGEESGEAYYLFSLAENVADVTFDSCLSRFDTYLRVISLSDGGWRQVAACDDCGDCASANRAKLSTGPLAAGDYLLLVEGWARAEGRYVVSVECSTLGTLVAAYDSTTRSAALCATARSAPASGPAPHRAVASERGARRRPCTRRCGSTARRPVRQDDARDRCGRGRAACAARSRSGCGCAASSTARVGDGRRPLIAATAATTRSRRVGALGRHGDGRAAPQRPRARPA